MITTAIACFVGAFAAMLALAEIQHSNRFVRYLLAFIVGVLVTALLTWFLQFLLTFFHRVG